MMPDTARADAWKPVLTAATEEARRRGDRRLGTDHLLLGLLHDGVSPAATALGVSLAEARAAADTLDRAALAAIGIQIQSRAGPAPAPFGRRFPPLTSGTKAVLKRAAQEARPIGRRRIGPAHFLLALLAGQRPDPAAELLDALGVDRAAVRQRLGGPAGGGAA
ncbi:MAG TPA: Clp protease N-terminal domain-containing protein [Streptosporangiaceae bacterium]